MANDHVFLASRLNNEIMFQERILNVNPDGTREAVWRNAFEEPIPAEVITIGGEEGRNAMMDRGEVRYRITIRYREDVDGSMRIRLDTIDSIPESERTYVDIKAPPRDPDGRRIALEINGEYKHMSAWMEKTE